MWCPWHQVPFKDIEDWWCFHVAQVSGIFEDSTSGFFLSIPNLKTEGPSRKNTSAPQLLLSTAVPRARAMAFCAVRFLNSESQVSLESANGEKMPVLNLDLKLQLSIADLLEALLTQSGFADGIPLKVEADTNSDDAAESKAEAETEAAADSLAKNEPWQLFSESKGHEFNEDRECRASRYHIGDPNMGDRTLGILSESVHPGTSMVTTGSSSQEADPDWQESAWISSLHLWGEQGRQAADSSQNSQPDTSNPQTTVQ